MTGEDEDREDHQRWNKEPQVDDRIVLKLGEADPCQQECSRQNGPDQIVRFSVFEKIPQAKAAQHNAGENDERYKPAELAGASSGNQVDQPNNQRIAVKQGEHEKQRYAKSPHEPAMTPQPATDTVKRQVENDKAKKGHEFNDIGVVDYLKTRRPQALPEIVREHESDNVQGSGQSV